jgi:methionyl aminopeptidase
MTTVKTTEEIALLRQGGKILARILATVASAVKPGVSTLALDQLAEKLVREAGGRPSFKNYGKPPYPATLCTSVNEQVVHGIPSAEVILREGDIISLDIGMQYPAHDGLYTDMAVTVGVGKISETVERLMATTKRALELVEENLKAGVDLQTLGKMIEDSVGAEGFGVVHDLVGHGVGYAVHEDPQVPNFYIPNYHFIVKTGMVLAFEPMVTEGDFAVETLPDDWTIATVDRTLAAHFEHTFVVMDDGCEVLTKE